MILDKTELWVAQTNSWVVAAEAGGPAVLIDSPPDPEGVAALLARHDLTVAAILLTHGHIDHMGSAQAVSDVSGAVIHVHPDDDFLTLDPMRQVAALFGPGFPGEYRAPTSTRPLVGGETLEVAGLSLEVIHTPGHTPGHCCFHLREEEWLFSGDHLFAGSVGRTDLPGGSRSDLDESMRSKILTLADPTRVLPGHGPDTTIGVERRSNPFVRYL